MEVLGQGFLAAYTEGDNSNVVATDTMKNVILRRALEHDGPTLEGFLDELGHGVPRHLSGDGGPAAVGARAAVRAGPGRRRARSAATGSSRSAAATTRSPSSSSSAARTAASCWSRSAAARSGCGCSRRPASAFTQLRARRRDDAARARRPAAVHPPRRALALRGSRRRARRRPGPLRRAGAGARRRLRGLPRVRLGVDPAPRARDGAAAARALPRCSPRSRSTAENHTHDPVPGSDAASGGRKAYTAAFPAWGLITLVLTR